MAPLTTTRTLLELRVGSIHTIEILLQIRLSDIAWWNSDLYNCERQLYKLIGRRVLPTECHEEIEADRARFRERTQDTVANGSTNNETKNKKGKVVIGEANLKKKKKEEKEKGGKKRGAAAAGKKGKKETKKSSRKQKVSDKDANESDSKGKLKLLREPGKWIMGKSIQICYMMEEIERSTATTLIFRPKETTNNKLDTTDSSSTTDAATKGKEDGAKKSKSSETSTAEDEEAKVVPLATFRTWKKLPKRINLWVFKFADDPTDLSVSEGGGFPRPELLPVSDIFRSIGDDDGSE